MLFAIILMSKFWELFCSEDRQGYFQVFFAKTFGSLRMTYLLGINGQWRHSKTPGDYESDWINQRQAWEVPWRQSSPWTACCKDCTYMEVIVWRYA